MMYQTVKTNFLRFHNSFRSSATIVFARVQMLLAAVWSVLIMTDLAPVIQNPKYVTAWLVFSGVITEYCRRRPSSIDPLEPVPSPAALAPTSGPLK
jgi:hypothetical protein